MVSCPQHGKVTVKVDLIFEEYVGLDIHEKHVVTGQIRSTQSYPGQFSPSAYTLPKEISILECNQGSKHNITTPVQDSTKILSPMPNFELLPEQEEVEELPTECDKDDDCQLITEQTVFEHIRKKSKNFPVLMKSNAMDSSYDPLILKRKCSLRNKHSSPAGGLSSGGIILIDSPPACASLVANVGAASTLSSFNVSPIQLDHQENFQSDSHGTIGCSWKFSTPSNAKNIAFSRISPIAEKLLGGSSVLLTSGNDKVVENVDGSSMPNTGKEQESLFSGFKSVFSFL